MARKCIACKFAHVGNYPRHGNGNSALSGLFQQQGSYCGHPNMKRPLIFYGATSPRDCPLKHGKSENVERI